MTNSQTECPFRSIEDMLVGGIDFAFIRLAKQNGFNYGEVLHIVRRSLGDIELQKHIQNSRACKHRVEQLIMSRLDAVECPSFSVIMRQGGGISPHQDVAKTKAHLENCSYCRKEVEYLRRLLPSNAVELNTLYIQLWGPIFDPPFGAYENPPRFVQVSREEFDQRFRRRKDPREPIERLSDENLNDLPKPLRNPESEI